MFNIGPLELLAILVVALLVVGPEELPRTARRFASFIAELRRQGEDVRAQVRELIDEAVSEEERRNLADSFKTGIEPLENSVDITNEDRKQ